MALKYFNVLSGISAGNITINAANNTVVASEFNGNVTGTILTSSQPNITSVGTLTSLNISGNANAGNIGATNFVGSGASLTTLNASNLSSGTVATARLGTGTANANTFLAGDNTWKVISTSGNTSFVFTQSTPATTWTINHNLGVQYVNIQVIDSTGNSFTGRYNYPTITFNNTTHCTVTFDSAQEGYAAITSGGGEQGPEGPAGGLGGSANTNILFNDSGNANGTANLTFNKSTNTLSVGNANVSGNTFLATSGGNVGIGTSSPTNALTVVRASSTAAIDITSGANTFQIYQTTAGEAAIVNYTSGGNITVSQAGAGFINFGTNGSERMRIDSSGNVGIGTSSPSAALDVVSSFQWRSDSAGTQKLAVFSGGAGLVYNGTTTNDALALLTNGGERMRIDSSGNVGIGTTNTSISKLVVSNIANSSSLESIAGTVLHLVSEDGQPTRLVMDQYGSTGAPNLIQRKSRGTPNSPSALLSGDTILNNAGFGRGTTEYTTTARAQMLFQTEQDWTDSNQGTRITFSTTENNTTTPTERLRIDNAGNVGIGATSPGSLLDVRGELTLSAGGWRTSAIQAIDEGGNFQGSLAFYTHPNSGSAGAPTERFRITSTGGITSSDLADAVGYKGIPQNSQGTNYTLALSDMGKHISISSGNITIPANGSVAFPIGSTIVIFNDAASTRSILITTDTLRQAGTTNTGTRTLAVYGVATLMKVTSTVWVVTGNVT